MFWTIVWAIVAGLGIASVLSAVGLVILGLIAQSLNEDK